MKIKSKHILGLILSLLATLGLIFLLNKPLSVGKSTIPPLGSFLSPQQGFWTAAESTEKVESFDLEIPGLTAPVTVELDHRLVPHIFATTINDAYAAQGYLHAKYRLFQMDLVTRNAAGQLAEILGPNLIKKDRQQRRLGLAWGAEKSLAAWKKSPDIDKFEAYTNGYNAYIKKLKPRDYPIEFKLLNYEPQPWTLMRSALLLKNMAQTLCSRNDDIRASNTKNWLGTELFNELFPQQMEGDEPVIPPSVEYPFEALLPDGDMGVKNLIGHQPVENPPLGIGSNNWAIDGSKSKSGNPILANDPHLSLTLPSIWYETHLVTPEMNVYGASLCGFPGVIIGFNDHIAWGVTNVGHDLTDWYQIDWVDTEKTKYRLDGQEKKTTYRIEKIKVKGQKDFIDSVKYTHWGPVYYEGMDKNKPALAMHWVGHETPATNELNSFLDLNQSKNFDEYTRSVQQFQTPPQNLAFISESGDIALRVQGRFPIKAKDQGLFVLEGNQSANGWKGWIPKDQTPAVLNPPRGFIASANQRSTAPNYPYFYNGSFEAYRGRTLNRKLTAIQNAEVKDMMALQMNNYSLKAEEFIPLLINNLIADNFDENAKLTIENLKNWNFEYTAHSKEAAMFEIWIKLLRQETWDEFENKNANLPIIFPKIWKLKSMIAESPDHIYFDKKSTTEKENAEAIITKSFMMMLNEASAFERNKSLTWRNYSPVNIPHLTRISAFSKNNIPANGCGDALNATRRSFGPSWRMIVEQGEKVQAFAVYPGGQSGNPGSPFYTTGLNNWTQGEYFPLEFVNAPNQLKEKIATITINQ